jgi:hypothetical protein
MQRNAVQCVESPHKEVPMSDRTDTDPSVKFPARPVDGNPAHGSNVAEQEDGRTLDAVLVDEVNGRALYAVVGFEGTDMTAERPLPPWFKK